MLQPQVASVSQTERLLAAMGASAVSHGQTVRADINRVEVSTKMLARPLVYFCSMRGLRVREAVRLGDGGPLPPEVTIAGLSVEREGFYDIRNALVSSNGRVEVTLDEQSSVTPVQRLPFSLSLIG